VPTSVLFVWIGRQRRARAGLLGDGIGGLANLRGCLVDRGLRLWLTGRRGRACDHDLERIGHRARLQLLLLLLQRDLGDDLRPEDVVGGLRELLRRGRNLDVGGERGDLLAAERVLRLAAHRLLGTGGLGTTRPRRIVGLRRRAHRRALVRGLALMSGGGAWF